MQRQDSIFFSPELYRLNPWWNHQEMRQLPKTRRHLVAQIKRRLNSGLAPVVMMRGSRQIGKTTACEQIISDFLEEGISPKRILRVQFDELYSLVRMGKDQPILRIVEWFEAEILGKSLNQSAKDGEPAFLFFDEVQNLDRWAEQVKFLVDASTVKIVVTGSSALRLELGRDSLAGRIQTLEASVLSLTEIGALRQLSPPPPFLKDNGLEPLLRKEFWQDLATHGQTHAAFRREVFRAFSERGAYPVSHSNPNVHWNELADLLNETVIKRVISHDLRLGERGRRRDETLLEELFRFCCRFAGQAPALSSMVTEMQNVQNASIGSQRVSAYLNFLADALLIRKISPLEMRLKKKRSDFKICLVDHSLRASWLHENIPLDPDAPEQDQVLQTLAGNLAESVTGSLFSSIGGLDLNWIPARNKDPEIDFVITIGATRIPVEVKYRNQPNEKSTAGLEWFLDNEYNRAPFGLLITKTDQVKVKDPRIVPIPLSSLMMLK